MSLNDFKPLIAASIGPYGAYLADGSEYHGNYGISEEKLREFHHQLQDIRVNHEYSATKDPGQDNKEWNKIRVRIV